MKLWEGPIGSNRWPVCGFSSDIVLANNGARVPSKGDHNGLSNPLWNVATDEKDKNAVKAVFISDDLVAKDNHIGFSKPEKQVMLVKTELGSERGCP